MSNQSAEANYAGVWGGRSGFGKKSALIVIDFCQAYTLPDAPLFASGVGPAVAESVELLQAAREAGLLVIHTTVKYHAQHFVDGGAWVKKSPVLKCLVDERFSLVCEGVEPLDSELVIQKQYASAFFGTSLASTLTSSGVDTVILIGCSTSGCVRASAVDGVQHGFNVVVPRECVGDRHEGPHEANLFDINSKYGDVISKAEVLDYVRSIKG
ncbi:MULTISPECIES: isochorismatase family protein [unclassified Burkholderia]|uniref:isochorismatase family protein n=1 Tax=unclassified Burkholderia TaxID=2613784 RepID=UPI000F59C49A|nr:MULTISPECIES: isochorismatase family protein [unclassified Burkholderia]RQS19121.1 isochorismatase family protein [Burkholderia sp. Bp8995]RQS38882.1 isochorismatase family protein [Burkholderia sp. Bp8989]